MKLISNPPRVESCVSSECFPASVKQTQRSDIHDHRNESFVSYRFNSFKLNVCLIKCRTYINQVRIVAGGWQQQKKQRYCSTRSHTRAFDRVKIDFLLRWGHLILSCFWLKTWSPFKSVDYVFSIYAVPAIFTMQNVKYEIPEQFRSMNNCENLNLAPK